jgi:hypothetical protein
MGMDLLRSCYTTKMRFWRDAATEVGVRWFFCAPDAEVFPYDTVFGSGNWASDRFDWPGPGEVLGAARDWSNGALPGELLGKKFCGPLEAYTRGATTDMPALEANVQGICCCCTCTCDCDDLVQRFEETMAITVTAVAGGGGGGLFHVGQLWPLTKNETAFPPYWETGEIATPGTGFAWMRLRVSCFDWGPLGRLVSLGRALAPDTVPTEWRIWIKDRCEPAYVATIDNWETPGPAGQTLTLKLTAKYRRGE